MTNRLFALCGLPALLASCAPMLPPVTAENIAPIAASRPWANLPELVSGRSLYAARCGSCHALPSIGNYPAQQWPDIVADMAPKALLDTAQSRRLLDWVLSEHALGR